MLNNLKDWYAARETREQRILLAGALGLTVLLFWGLVWAPLGDSIEREQARVDNKLADLQWMHGAAHELKTLGTGTNSRNARIGRGQSLLAIADRSLRAAGLGEALQRIQPDGETRVRVWLENAAFDASLNWLNTLTSQQGVQIDSLGVDRQDKGNTVNLQASLSRGGS